MGQAQRLGGAGAGEPGAAAERRPLPVALGLGGPAGAPGAVWHVALVQRRSRQKLVKVPARESFVSNYMRLRPEIRAFREPPA